MAFITKADLKSNMYPEIVAAVSRNDDTILDALFAETESMMRTFLGRYDANAIFSATGAARNAYVLKVAKNIAVYELMKLSNRTVSQNIRLDYEDAINWLNGINSGKYDAGDLPFLADAAGNTDIAGPVQWGSMEKTGYGY